MRTAIITATILALTSSTNAVAAGSEDNFQEMIQQETGTAKKPQAKPGMSLKAKMLICGTVVTVAGLGLAVVLAKKGILPDLSKLSFSQLSSGKEPKAFDFSPLEAMYRESASQLGETLKAPGQLQGRKDELKRNLRHGISLVTEDKYYGPYAQSLHGVYLGFMKDIRSPGEYEQGKIIASLKKAYPYTITLYTQLLDEKKINAAGFVWDYARFLGRLLNQLFFLEGLSLIYKDWEEGTVVKYLAGDKKGQPVLMLPTIDAFHTTLLHDYKIKLTLATNEHIATARKISDFQAYEPALRALLDSAAKGKWAGEHVNGLVGEFNATLSRGMSATPLSPVHNAIVAELKEIFPQSKDKFTLLEGV